MINNGRDLPSNCNKWLLMKLCCIYIKFQLLWYFDCELKKFQYYVINKIFLNDSKGSMSVWDICNKIRGLNGMLNLIQQTKWKLLKVFYAQGASKLTLHLTEDPEKCFWQAGNKIADFISLLISVNWINQYSSSYHLKTDEMSVVEACMEYHR